MGVGVTATMAALHPSLDRAMEIAAEVHGEEVVAAASNSLARLLGGMESGEWESSALGRTGFPVEFAFTSIGPPSLRFTSEIGGRAGAPRKTPASIARAGDMFRELSGRAVAGEFERSAAALQLGARLKYGAWLGCRHRRDGCAHKLYVEVPRGRAPDAVPAVTELAHRDVRVSMIGYQPDAIEIYYAVKGLRPGEVETAMAPIGLGSRAGEALDLLAEARFRPIHHEMPCTDFGFSYALPDRGAPVFTLYAFANSLFGGDGRIRTAVLRLAQRRGWHLPFYERLSAPLAGTRGFITHHGLFGVVVPAEGPLGISFGLAPPGPHTLKPVPTES